VLASRSADEISQLAQSLRSVGANVLDVPTDVTRPFDRERLLQAAVERFGGLDILVNNAGIASFGHFASSSEAVLRSVLEVNFFAPAELIREALPILADGRNPAIVNVSSMCGRRAMPAWSEYSAGKFALTGLTEALKGEMARYGVDMLLVLPGLTRSGLKRNSLRNDGRMNIEFEKGMLPEQVAEGILGALEANRGETVLGSDARWLLRLNRLFPRVIDWLVCRRVKKLYERPQALEAAAR
jgi:short-subunit dehydrogenase